VDDVLRWWLVVEVVGLAALPFVFRVLAFLPGRGLAFAKPFGLLLVAYVLWLGAFAGVLPFTGGSAALTVAALAVAGLWLAGRDRAALAAHLRRQWRFLLAAEVVFLLFFAGIAALRAWSPEIAGTEKPFESAFFQAVLRSETFGPRDPWYGGEPMSYYYYGYVLLGLITHLTGTAPEVAFNLGLALTGGLTAMGAFALVHDLLAAGGRLRPARALMAALAAPFVLLVVSNLEGVFELLAVHGVDAGWFYRAIAIEGLDGPKVSESWYPTEHWWWWRATRLGSSWNVQEFPFFSFLLGDLHAHVMVLPYTLLTLAAVFNLWRCGERLDLAFLRRRPWPSLTLALLAGSLYVINAWDFPTALVLLGLVVLARNYTLAGGGLRLAPLVQSAGFLVPVAVLAVVVYLPFYIGFTATPTEVRVTEVLYSDVERHAMATPPFQFFVFWGPMLFPAVSYLLWRFATLRPWRLEPALILLAAGAGVLPPLMWGAVVAATSGPGGLADELATRGHLLLTWPVVMALVVLAALVLLAEVFREDRQPADGTRVFLAAALLTAFLLILFAEFYFIVDIVVVSRHNTVFKFYYTAWLLLSVAGWTGIVEMVAVWWGRPSRARARPATGVRVGRVAWAGAGVALLLLSLVYPINAALARSNGFEGGATLDGLRSVRALQPEEYAAAMWLRRSMDGLPVVLEAEGPEYSVAGRVSSWTGLPTVVGWPNHEWQERGALAPVLARVRDVATLYQTGDPALARDLLDRYDVRFVYIGPYERSRYGATAGDTLAAISRLVFEAGGVRIYVVEDRPGSEEVGEP
jgi:YYY domain-containing protein